MTRVEVVTQINASLERCFDLARDMGIHEKTTGSTGERVVEIVRAEGLAARPAQEEGMLLGLGDVVTFEARHLGIRQRLTSKIVSFDRPHEFVDEMQRGAFKSLRHIHRFELAEEGIRMIDILEFESPAWVLGRIADALVLGRYMERFIASRGRSLKRIAENERSEKG